MTIGIYCLSFGDSDKVYIGQSINIERRYKRHINRLSKESYNNCRNYKLLKAYLHFGTPSITILESSTLELLDSAEIFWIKEFDSINNGLNICAGGKSGWGVNNGSSIYTEEQILQVFNLLSNSNCYTYSDIHDITKLPVSLISSIAMGSTHTWLEDTYYDNYYLMESLNSNRLIKANTSGHLKITAVNLGIQYPVIIDSDGKEYIVNSARGFALEHSIDPGNLIKMLDGKYAVCGKFRLKNKEDKVLRSKKIFGSLKSPGGSIYPNITNIRDFADTHTLDSSSIGKVLRGTKTSYKGWTLA